MGREEGLRDSGHGTVASRTADVGRFCSVYVRFGVHTVMSRSGNWRMTVEVIRSVVRPEGVQNMMLFKCHQK